MQFLSLVAALARTGEVQLTALGPPKVHPSVLPLVEPLRDQVSFTTQLPFQVADIYHRPRQVHSLHELPECFAYGRRFVLTQQDMILDRTSAYFPSDEAWKAYRRATQAALASADHVGFFSEHAALDAASDGALDPERATVVPLGVNHVQTEGDAKPPPLLTRLGHRPFLLMLGTALPHKNRLFALRVLHELVERGWEGGLVFAGGDLPWGSSTPDQRRLLEGDRLLRERVIDVGPVSETEKRALYRGAALVLFPSLYEGFGLIPFEAAAFGKPCLYAWRGPVREFLPQVASLPSDFSVPATASMILDLLGNPSARDALVSEIRSAVETLTWEDTARGYLEVYSRALASPPRSIDRAILHGLGPANNLQLSPQERRVIDVYRRRPGFKAAVESVLRVGAATKGAARFGRLRRRRTSADADT